jgi:hypothetical protein
MGLVESLDGMLAAAADLASWAAVARRALAGRGDLEPGERWAITDALTGAELVAARVSRRLDGARGIVAEADREAA